MHTLSQPQAEILEQGLLTSGFHCILQMPTGSGKTWLAEQAMEHTLTQNARAVYLAPLRSLASELTARWQTHFHPHRVGVFTGDYGACGYPYPIPFNRADLLVMTPERLDACTRAWRSHWHWIPLVDLVVVDEFHLLGEPGRGARLEGTLSRFRRLNPFARIIGLSATLGNRSELADWLEAVEYASDERPIPLEWRIARYRKADEKPHLVADAVHRTRCEGGKSLVFVQSRRRAEELSTFLCNAGLRAYHHHAGLSHETRRSVEEAFRKHEADVLVATATLEMGINLPVRQVILYDLQMFDGSDFRPLSTNSVWQRVGRAGRRGLDPYGEALLLAPAWDRTAEHYVEGRFEPIRSGLSDTRALAEQIVAEVASGLARTSGQLQATLEQSLAAHQEHLPAVPEAIQSMLSAGMISEKSSSAAPGTYKVTRLGRIAVRHFLSPATVLRFRTVLTNSSDLTFFDLLLLVCTSTDCEPVLPVDFEELDALAAELTAHPSYLLQISRRELEELLGCGGKRLLSAIKMALVLRSWTHLADQTTVAEQHVCYPFEVARLCESASRLLLALGAIPEPPDDEEAQPVNDTDYVPLVERVRALQTMVTAGLDESGVTLTWVSGLGPTLARRLQVNGIEDIEVLAQAEAGELASIRGLSLQRAQQWIDAATEFVRTRSAYWLRETGPRLADAGALDAAEVDPYRLRRALDLAVEGADGGHYLVSGGLEPHMVRYVSDSASCLVAPQQPQSFICDCADAARGHRCKHVLAVRLARGDRKLQQLAHQLTTARQVDRLNIFDLWLDGRSIHP